MMADTTITPRYKPGDRVQVRVNIASGHHRTPEYVQGKTGSIVSVHGIFHNPDQGGNAQPRQPLYLVSFNQSHIWEAYDRSSGDRLLLDIFEHWLESA